MSKNSIKWVVGILVIIIIVFISFNYIYKDHRNIETEKADFSITAIDLAKEFKSNITMAEEKFLNKTVVITGKISELNEADLTLDESVFSSFKFEIKRNELEINKTIKIKGRCIGYDDLLEQVKLDQCSIVN